MKKNLYIIIAVVIVAIAGIGAFALKNNNSKIPVDKKPETNNAQITVQADTTSTEYQQFAALSGEEYDRMFLANMIAHHQGAIDMANMASTAAKHDEIKDLARDIVTAQTTEITNMTDWQKAWGYPASSGEMMVDHAAMSMMDTNAGMMDALKGKTGDDFDKAFLEQMIMHHQSAINMATTGKTNALHQEVKDLTEGIVTAQTIEIKKMKQWQKDWAYTN